MPLSDVWQFLVWKSRNNSVERWYLDR